VDVNGTLAPNNFGIGGDVTLSPGSTLAVNLTGSSAGMLAITGNLDLAALSNSLNVSVVGSLSGSSWVIATYTGLLSGEFESVTQGYAVNYGTGTNSQITITLAPVLFGDYNGDGSVDAADYTVWRNHLGTNFNLNGNGNEEDASAGIVDTADYATWKANYGTSSMGGGSLADTNVPEPSTLLLLALAAILPLKLRKRR
jgi:hypothetical protein